MTGKELVRYLANLIIVAKADGSMGEEEQEAIAWAFEEIHARQNDFEEAKTITEDGEYQATPAGRYSERIRNLEDMIFVALSDSALSEPEKSLLRSFAKAIGAKKGQIDTIVSEAIARFRTYKATITCPNCRYEIPAAWRFCSECGTAIQARTV